MATRYKVQCYDCTMLTSVEALEGDVTTDIPSFCPFCGSNAVFTEEDDTPTEKEDYDDNDD